MTEQLIKGSHSGNLRVLPFLMLSSLMLMLSATFSSCKKINELTDFYAADSIQVVVDQAHVLGSPFDLLTPLTNTTTDSLCALHQTDVDKLNELCLPSAQLTVTPRDTMPDNYLQSLELYLLAPDQDDQLIAWNYHIEVGDDNTIALTLTIDNLKDLLSQKQYQYRVHGIINGDVVYEVTLDFHLDYYFNAVVD